MLGSIRIPPLGLLEGYRGTDVQHLPLFQKVLKLLYPLLPTRLRWLHPWIHLFHTLIKRMAMHEKTEAKSSTGGTQTQSSCASSSCTAAWRASAAPETPERELSQQLPSSSTAWCPALCGASQCTAAPESSQHPHRQAVFYPHLTTGKWRPGKVK